MQALLTHFELADHILGMLTDELQKLMFFERRLGRHLVEDVYGQVHRDHVSAAISYLRQAVNELEIAFKREPSPSH